MAEIVETSVDEFHVALLRLNRPEARNALSPEMMERIAAELERLDPDPEVRCVVIAGSDEIFAAGADIKAMAERTLPEALYHPSAAFWRRLVGVKTPLVAAVTGYALGGGCELALACDMIVADETASFGQPEIRLGIIPGGGGTQRLARAIGKQRAMEYVLTGRRFDAATAHAWGLVNKVAEQGRLPGRGAGAGPHRRRAAADRRPPRQAGGAGRRGDRRSPPGSRPSGGCSSWRWRPRTGSRACRPSSRSASRTSRAGDGHPRRRPRRRHDGPRASPRSPRWAASRPGSTTPSPRRREAAVAKLGEALAKGAARERWSEAEADGSRRAGSDRPSRSARWPAASC